MTDTLTELERKVARHAADMQDQIIDSPAWLSALNDLDAAIQDLKAHRQSQEQFVVDARVLLEGK